MKTTIKPRLVKFVVPMPLGYRKAVEAAALASGLTVEKWARAILEREVTRALAAPPYPNLKTHPPTPEEDVSLEELLNHAKEQKRGRLRVDYDTIIREGMMSLKCHPADWQAIAKWLLGRCEACGFTFQYNRKADAFDFKRKPLASPAQP